LFALVLGLALLAGFRWHAGLMVTAIVLAICVVGLAGQNGYFTHETKIGAAIAAMLLVICWKLRRRRARS
jgi:hypothetical protein